MVISCPATEQKMMFSSLLPLEQVVPIVGIVATSNGQTCDVHRFGCGKEQLLARPAHSCGILLQLRKMGADTLAAFFVFHDGSDGCGVGFTPREYSVGALGESLDGAIVQIFEVNTPDHPNSHCHALYYRNYGYTLAEKE